VTRTGRSALRVYLATVAVSAVIGLGLLSLLRHARPSVSNAPAGPAVPAAPPVEAATKPPTTKPPATPAKEPPSTARGHKAPVRAVRHSVEVPDEPAAVKPPSAPAPATGSDEDATIDWKPAAAPKAQERPNQK
jgi:hypothetical protein